MRGKGPDAFGCCQAHWGLPVGFLLLRYSVLFPFDSLFLLYLLFISWFICSRRWRMVKLGLLQTKHLYMYVSRYTSKLRVRSAPWNQFKPCRKIFLLTVPMRYFFLDHLCYLYIVFVMLSRLFIAALCSPAGKGLTSWLLFVVSNCNFVTFPCGILGQVWCLIVLIPDLCHLSYFIWTFFGLFFILLKLNLSISILDPV